MTITSGNFFGEIFLEIIYLIQFSINTTFSQQLTNQGGALTRARAETNSDIIIAGDQ